MQGRQHKSSGILLLSGFLLLVAPFPGSLLMAGSEESEEEPMLLGPVTRDDIESFMPEWVMAEVEAEPDLTAAEDLIEWLRGSEIQVFFGTWCADSGRELPRLWRALDDLGGLSPSEIRYIGVARDKSEPRRWVAGSDLEFVPTFIVHRDGEELGRIVESSPHGIEKDLLSILRGEVAGVITNRRDLQPGEE